MEYQELRRVILVTLLENPEGMTELGLGALLEPINQIDIAAMLTALVRDGDVDVDRVNHRGHRVFVATEKGSRGLTDQRFAAKERKCLTCSRQFWSTDAGNRMCEQCKFDVFESECELI